VTFVVEQIKTSAGVSHNSDGSFLLQRQRGRQCQDPKGWTLSHTVASISMLA